MASDGDHIGFRADRDVSAAVDRFEARGEYDSRTDAVQDMIRIAERETRYPVVYRLKTEVLNWAGHLGLAALLVVVAGFTTTVFTPIHGLQVALVLVAMALGLVAAYELARAVTGQSVLGRRLREALR